jgi:hypothetical protein
MVEEQENSSQKMSYMGAQDPSFLQYRLNTEAIIVQLEQTLTGELVNYIVNSQNGEIIEQKRVISNPLVNREGYASIINYVKMHINNQTVQGNMKDYQYNEFIGSVREEFSIIVIVNQYKWNISDANVHYIIECVLDVIKLFLSRTLDNKERESYNTMRETSQFSRSQKGWGLK